MADKLIFPAPRPVLLPISGRDERYPVNRIFCVGRNYAGHAREMGVEVDREAPFYFTKPSCAYAPSGGTVPYPPGTRDCHYEMEFVVALGAPAFRVPRERAMEAVYGYAGGLDMTRRDLQNAARGKGRPWDLGKAFEHSAIIGPLTPKAAFGEIAGRSIVLTVNGEVKQSASVDDMVWPVPDLIADLSLYYHLRAGDLIFTGTPEGVGPVRPGDRLVGVVEGCDPVETTIGEAA